MQQAYHQKIYDSWGGLVDYWYPLTEISALNKNTAIKVRAFSLHYIVWMNHLGELSVFLDTCAHKQSPLSSGKVHDGKLQCPYHGWQFDHQGACVDIPYSNNKNDCNNKQLVVITSKVEGQILWFYPGDVEQDKKKAVADKAQINWQYQTGDIIKKDEFDCDEQLLIENFMDSPHTNFIHTGLIRKKQTRKSRDIKIYLDKQQKLYVDHLPNDESLGPFNWFINPNKDKVTHQDIFVAPSEIDIHYQFEKNKTNFRTQIMTCPIDENTTRAFFKVSCQFRMFNPLIRLGLRLFLPVVLWQDKRIVSLQANNPSKLVAYPGAFIHYDIYSYQVKLLRQQARTKQCVVGLLSSSEYTSLTL